MDIWQRLCVIPAIYGISKTVISHIFQSIKTGSWKSTIWFETQLENKCTLKQTRLYHTALWKCCPCPLIYWVYRVCRGLSAQCSFRGSSCLDLLDFLLFSVLNLCYRSDLGTWLFAVCTCEFASLLNTSQNLDLKDMLPFLQKLSNFLKQQGHWCF